MARVPSPGMHEPAAIGSYWESTVQFPAIDKQLFGEACFDVAIIGAGYTGLSAALVLAKAGLSVCVLDARQVGWGASGRNGGFCCYGGTTLPDSELVQRYGLDEARRFKSWQRMGMELVAERLVRWNVKADIHSKGEVTLAHRQKDVASLEEEASFTNQAFGTGARLLNKDELKEQGLKGPEFHGGLYVPHGFALNPMRYVEALAHRVRVFGVKIFCHSEVTSLKKTAGEWRLSSGDSVVRAGKVLLAGNGYSREGVPDWLNGRLLPVMSSILVTRPLSETELSEQGWFSDLMAADSRTLLHYFRLLPDRRFLFGTRGGIFEGQRSMEAVHLRGRSDFERMFPAWKGVETDYAWHGHVCLARSQSAFLGAVPGQDGLYAALGWHGSGIAMASLCGARAGELMTGKLHSRDIPAPLSQPPARFPLSFLRPFYLQAAYWWYGFQDR